VGDSGTGKHLWSGYNDSLKHVERIDAVAARTTMSKLDHIRIAKPCPASWAEMEGDEKARHCTHCNLKVYNLTAMTRAEAEQLIATRDGRLCLRYYRRADGRIMTSDCPVGVRRTRSRRLAMSGGLLAFMINLALAIQPADILQGDATASTYPQVALPGDQAIMGHVPATEPIHMLGKLAAPKQHR
jgi:hypothetical protein